MTKFVDHGAYGAAVFNGYVSNTANNDNGVAGKILTVTSITSGVIEIGSQISGGAVGNYTLVTGFTSGTRGGAGVYALTRYPTDTAQIVRATTGLIGSFAGMLTTPLAWGVPQEGDGIGKTPSTSSATTLLDMSGATAIAGNTVSVMGALLTCVVSGAGSNQFNAGSGATLVANLVAAINRTTNTNTVAAQATGWVAHKLQNAVFAKQGTTTTNLEIMTRAGSATYNGLIAMTWAGVTGLGSSPTWSGGVSGCWGVFTNAATMLPSAIAPYGYGVYGGQGPLAGALLAGDKVVERSGKTVVLNTYGAIVPTSLLAGTKTAPIRIEIDDSTDWSDGTNPVFLILGFITYYLGSSFGNSLNSISIFYSLAAKRYNYDDYGFLVEWGSSASGLGVYLTSSSEYAGCKFRHNNPAAALLIYQGLLASNDGDMALFKNCLFSTPQTASMLAPYSAYQNIWSIHFQDCLFSNLGNSGASLEFLAGGGQAIRQQLRFTSCRWVDYVSGSLNSIATNSGTPYQAYFSNCDFGNIGIRGPAKLLTQSSVVAASSQYGKREFFVSTMTGFVEWTANRSFPVCNAKLLNGTDGWSIHMVPTTTAGILSRFNPLKSPRIGKINSLATGARTLTIELAVHAALAWDKSDISALIEYVGTDGVLRTVDTYDYDGAALDVSTTAWSVESGGQVTYVDASLVQYHNKVKFSVTTPTEIAQDTEISITICLHSAVAAATQGVFVDPEIVVA